MTQAALRPTAIGDSLDPVRAAIEVVQRGVARRVVITAAQVEELLPAARVLARIAGLEAKPVPSTGHAAYDIAITKRADD